MTSPPRDLVTATTAPSGFKLPGVGMSWRAELVLVAACVMLYVGLGLSAAFDKSIMVDELFHLVGGVSYWEHNDYRVQPENGNLPQRWCTLPLVIAGLTNLPEPENESWKTGNYMELGPQYLERSKPHVRRLLVLSRAAAILFGVLTLLLVYVWSRDLFGRLGGLFSLLVAATDPTLLAFGPCATSDLCAAVMFSASLYALWKFLERSTPPRLAATGLAVGALFLSKMSAPLVLPMAGLLVLIRLFGGGPYEVSLGGTTRNVGWKTAVLTWLGGAGLVMLVAMGMVWGSFGFRYAGMNPEALPMGEYLEHRNLEQAAARVGGIREAVLRQCAEWRLLPEAYLYGTAFVMAGLSRASFLLGTHYPTGTLGYFPFVALVKTPLPTMAALFFGASALVSREGPRIRIATHWLYRLSPLLVLTGVYGAFAITSGINIGHRHLLPAVLPIFVLVGLVFALPPTRVRNMVAGVIAAAALVNAVWAWPNYLAYFNGVIRTETAYQSLVDGTVDWGQDLPALRRWLTEHQAPSASRPVYVLYFGVAKPQDELGEGIRRLPPDSYEPGLYCISATYLQGCYIRPGGGAWSAEHEAEYQRARQAWETHIAPILDRKAAADGMDRETLLEIQKNYEWGQFLRLLAGLRLRQPTANINGSILVFDVSAETLEQLLFGPSPLPE